MCWILQCVVLHYTTLHYTTLHYITLQYNTCNTCNTCHPLHVTAFFNIVKKKKFDQPSTVPRPTHAHFQSSVATKTGIKLDAIFFAIFRPSIRVSILRAGQRITKSLMVGLRAKHSDERALCEAWLRQIDFLVPGEDITTWCMIQNSWSAFLAASTYQPSDVLSQFKLFRGWRYILGSEETREEIRTRLYLTRQGRQAIDFCIRDHMDRYEAKIEKWLFDNADGTNTLHFPALMSLAASRDIKTRRQYHASLTGFISFLVYSHENSMLREMGLKLDYTRRSDLQLLVTSMGTTESRMDKLFDTTDYDCLWDRIEWIMRWSIESDENASPRNEPLLWWTAVLVRAAIAERWEQEEFSNIGDDGNPLPENLGIGEHIDAIIHCYKVFLLNESFKYWSTCPKDACAGEVRRASYNKNNDKDNRILNWLEGVKGRRLHARSDIRSCSSDSWPKLLSKMIMDLDDCLGPHGEQTPLGKLRVLREELASLDR